MDLTPCRLDRGRALAAMAHKIGSEEAYIRFADGKRYVIGPFYRMDWEVMVQPQASPGCHYNKVLRRRRRYYFRRVSWWPTPGQSDWLSHHWPTAAGIDSGISPMPA